MKQRFRSGGLAGWSITHPIGVCMLALTVVVLGLFSLDRLGIDLLPDIIYPEVRVRINDPGVPALIMEDRITRQLEEQLAITENAIGVLSNSTEGQSSTGSSMYENNPSTSRAVIIMVAKTGRLIATSESFIAIVRPPS